MNTKYILGLPCATQIGLEHEEKKPKDYDNDHCQPADPPPLGLTAVKDSMVFVVVETFPNSSPGHPCLPGYVSSQDHLSSPCHLRFQGHLSSAGLSHPGHLSSPYHLSLPGHPSFSGLLSPAGLSHLGHLSLPDHL